ncbi:cytosol aminopeptidase [Nematocida sp. AWRm80]|nr:cytosol aminopeptidase [Nematocida sp. AWRm80]
MLDWKRLCFRSRDTLEKGKIGEVLLFNQVEDLPESLREYIVDKDNSSGYWIVNKERTYVLCMVPDKKKECGIAFRCIAAKGVELLLKEKVSSIVVSDQSKGEWIAEAIVLASYQYDVLHSAKKTQVSVVYSGESQEIKQAIAIAEAQCFAKFLVETPANLMTPTLFTEYAKEYLPEGVEVKVYNKDEIQKMEMNLFLGVSQGSVQEPKLLEIKYTQGTECIALVGKGITFDSGGISLKPAAKMSQMKGDMGGGASVISTIGALARLQAKVSVVGIVPLTENLPSGTATKPGDVHIGCAGKSVEVDNTDAEGRLVLADALHHSLSFNPKTIIDVATLTGAINVALGPVMAGLFSNSDDLAKDLQETSFKVGDPAWRLPVTCEYSSLITSDVADLKNVGGPGAGSITAALFLKEFVGDIPWAHLDIAGVSFNTLQPALYGKTSTGRPVKLLTKWMLKQ